HKEQFSAFIKVLAEKFKPLYIYCFAQFVESSRKSGCFIDNSADEACRYYLLMITESSTRIEHEVQNYANDQFQHGTITLLVHGKETLTEAVRANNRFFITVANSGELLYSHDGMIRSFQVPDFIPTQAAVKARKHYRHRTDIATGFLESAMECLRKGKYQLSVFMLHQVVEQCCIALIRVHLAYRSDIHNLYRLLRLCDSFSPALSVLFLEESEEGRRLFDLMVKSYSAARYKDDFHVEQSDAEKLYNQVAVFLKLTGTLCSDKIELLAIEAEVYKHLQTGRETDHV
ncbi:MAG: HEPN domain-containing protein, partial [Pedobacter sp.]|uniref:HEPN domain-containing protein n=1 Tax=Pedobacter sp. TaxID=1411316 RepID=UPI0033972570